VGSLGYAACAAEILAQSAAMGIDFAQVITANGSAGTHAGLAAGFAAAGRAPTLVKSFAVLATEANAAAETLQKANATLALLTPGATLAATDIVIDGSHRGPGYGIPTDGMLEAVRVMARTQGLLLDPVYSGKAFAGLLHDVRAGRYAPGSAVLFVMTGGVPGLFAYPDILAGA
jgi:L-cysteate sulfo-lyase